MIEFSAPAARQACTPATRARLAGQPLADAQRFLVAASLSGLLAALLRVSRKCRAAIAGVLENKTVWHGATAVSAAHATAR